MKNMFNVTTVLPHNLLQTNPCIRHNFSTHVFTASTFAGVRTLVGRGRFFFNTEPLVSYCCKSLQIVCLQGVHLVPKCARKRLWVATTLFVSATARCPPFYKLVTSINFPWTTAFTRTFETSILWCYNFNGMIKWYDISCAILCVCIYIYIYICVYVCVCVYVFT